MMIGPFKYESEPHLDLKLSFFFESIGAHYYYFNKLLKSKRDIRYDLGEVYPDKFLHFSENIKTLNQLNGRIIEILKGGDGFLFIKKFLSAKNIEKKLQELINKCLNNTQKLEPLGIVVLIETTQGEKSISPEVVKRVWDTFFFLGDKRSILYLPTNNPFEKKNGASIFVMVITKHACFEEFLIRRKETKLN